MCPWRDMYVSCMTRCSMNMHASAAHASGVHLFAEGKKKTKMLAVLPYRVLFPTAGPGPQIQDRRGESGALIWAALSLPKTYGLHVLTGRLSFALSCIIGVSVKQQESGGR